MKKIVGALVLLVLGVLFALLRPSRTSKTPAVVHENEEARTQASEAPLLEHRRSDPPAERSASDRLSAEKLERVAERRRQLRQSFSPMGAHAEASVASARIEGAPVLPRQESAPSSDVEVFARAVGQRIRSDFAPMAEGCYKELLSRAPAAAGNVVMRFEILADPSLGGVVNEAELADQSTLRDSEFDTCLRESFLSLDFDSVPARSRATLRFRFQFADGKVDASDELHIRDRRAEKHE